MPTIMNFAEKKIDMVTKFSGFERNLIADVFARFHYDFPNSLIVTLQKQNAIPKLFKRTVA